MEKIIQGKESWRYISGSDPQPTEDEKKIFSWIRKDAKTTTWIVSTVLEPHLILNLKPYKTAEGMWNYLKKVYHRENSVRKYQLEFEISQHAQGNSSIQDYYSSFLALWTEYDKIKYADVSDEVLSKIQAIPATTHRDQFFYEIASRIWKCPIQSYESGSSPMS